MKQDLSNFDQSNPFDPVLFPGKKSPNIAILQKVIVFSQQRLDFDIIE